MGGRLQLVLVGWIQLFLVGGLQHFLVVGATTFSCRRGATTFLVGGYNFFLIYLNYVEMYRFCYLRYLSTPVIHVLRVDELWTFSF